MKVRLNSVAAVVLCLVGIVIVIKGWSWWLDRPSQVLRTAEKLDHDWALRYRTGTFEETTNAIIRFINYTKLHERDLRGFRGRDVDGSLHSAYSHLGYMLLCAGKVTEAYNCLKQGLAHYNRVRARFLESPMSGVEYLDFVISGIGTLDSRHGAHWRADFMLDTNSVARVKELFALQSGQPEGKRPLN